MGAGVRAVLLSEMNEHFLTNQISAFVRREKAHKGLYCYMNAEMIDSLREQLFLVVCLFIINKKDSL